MTSSSDHPQQNPRPPHHLFIGIDRSDTSIDCAIYDDAGRLLSQEKSRCAPEALLKWIKPLLAQCPAGATIALCIEQPCANLVHFFSPWEAVTIYLANPAVIKKYRESLSPSRAKDDARDARALGHYVFERHNELKPWQRRDPLADQIATLVEKRRQLVRSAHQPLE